MGYCIRYLRDGVYRDDFHWDKSLAEARAASADWLVLYGADHASILDMENKQKLVATVSRPCRDTPGR